MWLVEICSKLDSRSVYRLTRYWKTIDAKKVHVWVTLIMRDPSKELKDMPKRLKTGKSDRIRKSREEQIVKIECKEYTPPIIPTTIIWKIKYLYMIYKSM